MDASVLAIIIAVALAWSPSNRKCFADKVYGISARDRCARRVERAWRQTKGGGVRTRQERPYGSIRSFMR